MKKQFLQFIKQHKLWRPGDCWLLAISGGLDSMVLAHLAIASNIPIILAHVNFKLRGKDADSDEDFILHFASANRLICHAMRFDTQTYAQEQHLSIETAARELRYEWFNTLKKQYKFTFIATAHHLDDQVETLFMNLVKGTGIAGMRSILPKQNSIIRPLLFASRSEILAYAKQNHIQWREDDSNKDEQFTRNKIRSRLIPLLKEFNPNLSAAMIGNFSILRDLDNIYFEQLELWKKKFQQIRNHAVYISVRKLMQVDYKRSVLFELLRPYGFSGIQIDEILYWMKNPVQGKQWLSTSNRILCSKRFLIRTSLGPENTSWIPIDKPIGSFNCGTIKLVFSTHAIGKYTISRKAEIANLDFDKLNFPLLLRPWKAGDYFYPYGLSKKSHPDKKVKKKISDYLNDLKMDPLEKENVRLLCCDEKIVWVVGYRIDARFSIGEATSRVCKIKYRQIKLKYS